MYEDQKKFDKKGQVATKINRILNYMSRILKDQPPEMDIKWGFTDLYLVISVLEDEYVLNKKEEDFLNFYTSFEQQRRQALSDPASLLEPGRSIWDRDLYEYIEAFVKDGGKRENIRKRHQVYLNTIHQTIPNLVPKDSTRAYTNNERLIIWRRDNETCIDCGNSIKFNEMHADHIVPHSKGGKTTVENGQSLCISCNLKKGSKI
jgi:5-methylcytosine-specific restriction endonuclease McrA